jgi:hypothetical protein
MLSSDLQIMANRQIEIHDSELKAVTITDGNIVLELSPAYIHMSDGSPGIDAGTGWLQNAVIRVRSEGILGSISELPCDLWDGHLKVNGELFDNLVPIPLDSAGNIELQLTSVSGESLQVRGNRITLELLGEPEYIEKFPRA